MKSNNKRRALIKKLLTEELTKEQRKEFANLEPVDVELRKQWNTLDPSKEDAVLKNEIWQKIQQKRTQEKKRIISFQSKWYMIAASVALLITTVGLWFLTENKLSHPMMEITAQERGKLIVLPDSTKVWMEQGSTLKYAQHFEKDRKVWLTGNSYFEVRKKINGQNFQVHIDKAFIEVKGTCFLVKQFNTHKNEITLFNGKIEFHIPSTGEKKVMKPSQKVIYDADNAQTELKEIKNMIWKNGKFYYTDMPLTEFVNIINEIYFADVVLDKNICRNCAFTGSLRYDEPLEDVVNKICFSLNLTKEKQGSKIIIKK